MNLCIADKKFTFEEAANRCGVDSDTVRSWIKEGLPSFVDEDGLERIKSEPLSYFLQWKNDSNILTRFFELDKFGETWASNTKILNRFFTKNRVQSLEPGLELNKLWNKLLNYEKSLTNINHKYCIKAEKPTISRLNKDFHFLDIYKILSIKKISELCGTTKKTVFAWRNKGLELKRNKTKKRGDLYATSGDLISFLVSNKNYFKYLQKVLGYPLSDFAKQLKERKVSNDFHFDKQKEQVKAALDDIYKKLSDDIEKDNIELLPIAGKNSSNVNGQKSRAEKFIIENVIKKTKSYVPGKEKEAIWKELLRKLNILKRNKKDLKSEYTKKWIGIKQHRCELYVRVRADELAKSYTNKADKKKVIDRYVNIVKAEGWKPIETDLVKIGFTSDFIWNELVNIKPNPLRKIICHIIPDKKFTLSVIIKTITLIDYLAPPEADVLMQSHFLKGKYQLQELHVYAACQFLHQHIWSVKNDMPRHLRVEGVAAMLDIRWQRVNEIILQCDNDLNKLINNLLKPPRHEYVENTEIDLTYGTGTDKTYDDDNENNPEPLESHVDKFSKESDTNQFFKDTAISLLEKSTQQEVIEYFEQLQLEDFADDKKWKCIKKGIFLAIDEAHKKRKFKLKEQLINLLNKIKNKS